MTGSCPSLNWSEVEELCESLSRHCSETSAKSLRKGAMEDPIGCYSDPKSFNVSRPLLPGLFHAIN